MFSPRGPYWFFLNSSSRRSLSGCSPSLALTPLRYCRNRNAPCQAVDPERPEPELMPCRGMAEDRARTLRHHRQRLHVHREGVDLNAVDLIARKRPGQRVDRDVLWLDV